MKVTISKKRILLILKKYGQAHIDSFITDFGDKSNYNAERFCNWQHAKRVRMAYMNESERGEEVNKIEKPNNI